MFCIKTVILQNLNNEEIWVQKEAFFWKRDSTQKQSATHVSIIIMIMEIVVSTINHYIKTINRVQIAIYNYICKLFEEGKVGNKICSRCKMIVKTNCYVKTFSENRNEIFYWLIFYPLLLKLLFLLFHFCLM